MTEHIVSPLSQPTAKHKNAIYVTHSIVQLIAWPVLIYLNVIAALFTLIVDIPVSYFELWQMQQISTLVNVLIALVWSICARTTIRTHCRVIGILFVLNTIGAGAMLCIYQVFS